MENKYVILAVEESANQLGFYDSSTGVKIGSIQLSLWPHEIATDSKFKRAYVTNFGVRDYDLSIGYAGNSISIIDIESMCEIDRLYTTDDDVSINSWAPHGIKVSPDDKFLYVNVERTESTREASPHVKHGQEETIMLIFDLTTGKQVRQFNLPKYTLSSFTTVSTDSDFNPLVNSYSLLPGTHNFVFSPDGKYLWLFSGITGVTKIDPSTGKVLARLTEFNGAVRALHFSKSGKLLVSATNEVSLVDIETNSIIKKIGNLGVGQILYSKITHDEKYIIAPAVWEGKILIIDVNSEKIIHSITTGIDPVQIELSPDGNYAISTHGRSNWLTEIDLRNFSIRKLIPTTGGPNGAKYVPKSIIKEKGKLIFYAFLPFTNRYSAIGREMRLGYQFWNDKVNKSGGMYHNGKSYATEIVYIDTESNENYSELLTLMNKSLSNVKVDFLLGSYGYQANNALAEIADSKGILNLCSTFFLKKDNTHKYGNTYHLNKKYEGNLNEVISAIFAQVAPKPKDAWVLSSTEPDYIIDSEFLSDKLKKRGINLLSSENSQDFATIPTDNNKLLNFCKRIADSYPDLILINGNETDVIHLLKTFNTIHFTTGAICINADLAFSGFVSKLDKLRENLFSFVQWTPEITNSGHDRFGSAEDFYREYYNEYSERPSSFAAGTAAVGVILEEILRNSTSLDITDTKQILEEMSFQTFYDKINFNKDGENISKQPYVIQIQNNSEKLIWPLDLSKGNKIAF